MPEAPARQTVLVVDDDAELRGAIAEYLQSKGFEVAEAENGLEALLKVKRVRPDAVIMDVMMPRLGGLDALKRVRAFDPQMAVIVVTGTEDPGLKDQALSLGAAAFHAKPFNFADLLPALGRPKRSEEPAEKPERLSDALASPVPSPFTGRILVVDDEMEIRTVLEEFLTQQGYQVGSAEDGATAVRIAIEKVPDVILLDINMPKLSGLEALTAIRAINPGIKVIMISAQSDLGIAKRSLAYGAYDYIAKPFDMTYLANSVETALLAKDLDSDLPRSGAAR